MWALAFFVRGKFLLQENDRSLTALRNCSTSPARLDIAPPLTIGACLQLDNLWQAAAELICSRNKRGEISEPGLAARVSCDLRTVAGQYRSILFDPNEY